jgi:hypothetical protein
MQPEETLKRAGGKQSQQRDAGDDLLEWLNIKKLEFINQIKIKLVSNYFCHFELKVEQWPMVLSLRVLHS